MEAKDIVKIKKNFWKDLGDNLSTRVFNRTTKAGMDVNRKPFKGYSDSYEKRKAKGGGKRQSSTSKKPDLQFTGDMMRNLKTRSVKENRVEIGWSGTHAGRVRHNAKMGRVVTSDDKPLSDPNVAYAEKRIGDAINKNIIQYARKPINFKIGK